MVFCYSKLQICHSSLVQYLLKCAIIEFEFCSEVCLSSNLNFTILVVDPLISINKIKLISFYLILHLKFKWDNECLVSTMPSVTE